MKKLIILTILYFIAISCSSSIRENRIVNDFLNVELQKTQYDGFEKEMLLIKEAGIKNSPLIAYQQLYNERNDAVDDIWILDSNEIKKFKAKNSENEMLSWQEKDFPNLPITIIRSDQNLKNYKSGKYLRESEKLVIKLSKPLKLNKSQYLLYYYGKSTVWGGVDSQFVVEMLKRGDKWIVNNVYLNKNFFP